MKSNKVVWIIVGVCCALVISFIIWIFSSNNVNWTKHYSIKSKQPYGTKFIHQLLKEKYGRKNFKLVKQPFNEQLKRLDGDKKYDYIRIGSYLNYDQPTLNALLEFAEKGNNVFISDANTQEILLDTLFRFVDSAAIKEEIVDVEEDDYWSDSIYDKVNVDSFGEVLNQFNSQLKIEDDSLENDDFDFNFFDFDDWFQTERSYYNSHQSLSGDFSFTMNPNEKYSFYSFYKLDTFKYNWSYLNHTYLNNLDSLEFNVISKEYSNNIVMLDIPYGKGHIYIHENPITFTNVQLLIEERLKYTEHVFAFLDGEVLLWDVYRRNKYEGEKTLPSEEGSSSPLSYFLANKALRWSVYLSLIGAILFIAFKAKRKQQFIPVTEPNINTSLEYVEMMSQLYFKEQNHQFIAAQLWKKWVDFLREHYFVIAKENETSWITKVADKTMFPEAKIQGILMAYQKSKTENFNENDLINFYNKLQYFYSNCK